MENFVSFYKPLLNTALGNTIEGTDGNETQTAVLGRLSKLLILLQYRRNLVVMQLKFALFPWVLIIFVCFATAIPKRGERFTQ